MKKYSDSEIEIQILEKFSKWFVDGKDLCREFIFDSYLNSIEFVNAIGIVSDAMDHHPIIEISFGKVLVQVHTHSIGGIGPLDFEMASKLDIFYLLHRDIS
jgi:4a-hydroxytetrahydrobiopterin dehydratase